MLPVRIHHEYLAIQVQQRIQTAIADLPTSYSMLSVSDNLVKLVDYSWRNATAASICIDFRAGK